MTVKKFDAKILIQDRSCNMGIYFYNGQYNGDMLCDKIGETRKMNETSICFQ